jgi:outer membrane lipoprotein Slp family protein
VAAIMLVVVCTAASGCGAIPSKYLREAQWVTLTQLRTHPELYRGKTIILGGAIVMQRTQEGRVWLLVRNRPLDRDYVPHRAAIVGGIEDGHYWIVVTPEALPRGYQHWGRLTVVGKVGNQPPPDLASAHDPMLYAMYLRGWKIDVAESTWEATVDPSYIPSMPPEVKIE